MEVSGQLHTPAALPQGKEPRDSNWIADGVGARAGLAPVARRKIPSPHRTRTSDHPAHNPALYHSAIPAPISTYAPVQNDVPVGSCSG
jgi:hypothetical protein